MSLDKLPLAAMQAIEPRITKAVFGVLSVERSVAEPGQLRRHRARECAARGDEVVEKARQKVTLGSQVCRRRCLSLAALDLLYVSPVSGVHS